MHVGGSAGRRQGSSGGHQTNASIVIRWRCGSPRIVSDSSSFLLHLTSATPRCPMPTGREAVVATLLQDKAAHKLGMWGSARRIGAGA